MFFWLNTWHWKDFFSFFSFCWKRIQWDALSHFASSQKSSRATHNRVVASRETISFSSWFPSKVFDFTPRCVRWSIEVFTVNFLKITDMIQVASLADQWEGFKLYRNNQPHNHNLWLDIQTVIIQNSRIFLESFHFCLNSAWKSELKKWHFRNSF